MKIRTSAVIPLILANTAFAVEFNLDRQLPPELASSIAAYYQAEDDGDWVETYGLRTPDYRAVVPFDDYVEEMSTKLSGNEIISVSARLLDHKGNSYILKTEFVETHRGIPHGDPTALPISRGGVTDEITEWVFRDERWYCVSCGIRRRLPLNGRMAEPSH